VISQFITALFFLATLLGFCRLIEWLCGLGLWGFLSSVPVVVTALLIFRLLLDRVDSLFRIMRAAFSGKVSLREETIKQSAAAEEEWIKFRTEHFGMAYSRHFVLIAPQTIRERLGEVLKKYYESEAAAPALRAARPHMEGFIYEPFSYVRRKIGYGWIAFNEKDLATWEDKEGLLSYRLLFNTVRTRVIRRKIVITYWNRSKINKRIVEFLLRRYADSIYKS